MLLVEKEFWFLSTCQIQFVLRNFFAVRFDFLMLNRLTLTSFPVKLLYRLL